MIVINFALFIKIYNIGITRDGDDDNSKQHNKHIKLIRDNSHCNDDKITTGLITIAMADENCAKDTINNND